MADISQIVTVTITAETLTPTLPGFGTPLIAAAQVPAGWGSALVRSFTKLSDLTTLGFTANNPAYLAASAIVAQNPKVTKFKIGKRALPPTQTLKLKCTSAVTGDIYTVTAGFTAAAAVSYTVPGASTTTTVATALAALLTALADVTATAATDTITVTVKALPTGALLNIANLSANLQLTDATADPGIATDLAAILQADPDWYGLVLDSNSKLEILAAAAWCQTNGKLLGANTSDYGAQDSVSTTDVAYVAKAGNYSQTYVGYSSAAALSPGSNLLSYLGAAIMGKMFPYSPGKATWAHKRLNSVFTDNLTPTQITNLEAKNCNYYTSIASIPVFENGKCASGDWIDTIQGIAWLTQQMQIQVFGYIANQPKVPYTDKGIANILGVVRSVLRAGVNAGLLADDANLYATAPAAADVDSITRGTRVLPLLNFGARLAGAVHKTLINGTVSN